MEFSFFEMISEMGLTLDHIYILSFIKNNTIEGLKDKKTQKVKGILNTLKRKNIIDEEGKINEAYIKFADAFSTEKIDYSTIVSKVKSVKSKEDEAFEEWWENYPKSDNFEYRNIKFPGTRALRQSKNDCKAKFKLLLLEGYDYKKLINALKAEVQLKLAASYRTKTNKLTFMQNSLTYLNKRTFEAYMDIEEIEEEPSDSNVKDINI